MIINRGSSIDEIAKRLAERDRDSRTPPDKEIKEPEKQDPDKKVESGNQGLVYAVNFCVDYKTHCNIYLFVDGKKDILIRYWKGYVNGLCEYEGKLYDGEDNVVKGGYNTIRETLTEKKVASDKESISDMCSHHGNLLYLTKTGVTNVFTGEKKRSNEDSLSLCSHKGELYEAGRKGIVYLMNSFQKIKVMDIPIYDLCSHKGELYGEDRNNRVFEIDKGIISTGKEAIFSLCSHNGILYAGTANHIQNREGEIYEVPSGETLLRVGGAITAMCSVSPGIVNQIMKMNKQKR